MKAVWVIMVLFGIAFSAAMIYTTYQNRDLNPDLYGFVADVDGDHQLTLKMVQGDPIPMQDLVLTLQMDGGTQTYSGIDLGLGDDWTAGETTCLVGPSGCLRTGTGKVTLSLRVENQTLFSATRTVA